MANVKISELPVATSVDVVDTVPLVQGGTTKQATQTTLLTTTGNVTAAKLVPTGGTATGNGMYLPATNALAWSTNGAEGMRLDASGNLGIGTSSPLEKLHVNQGNIYTLRTGGAKLRLADQLNEVSFESVPVGSSSDAIWKTSSVERMRLDSSGNLGLGVTPSAWNLGKAIEVNNVGNALWGAAASEINVTQNAYYNSGWIYAASSFATRYEQNTGVHRWYTAPSGTAGNAISFTQAMTLDASGNLGIGITSPSYPLHISKTFSLYGAYIENLSTNTSDYNVLLLTGASSGMPAMMVGAGGTAVANAGVQGVGYVGTQNNTPLVFVTNDAARARITSGGDLLVGTASSDGSRLRVYGPYQTLGDGAYEGLIGKASSLVSGGGSGDFAIRSAANLVFATNGNSERARITSGGDFIHQVNGTAPSLSTNSTMSFELTSNTSLKIVVRGTDGVTRSVSLTLA